MKAITYVILDRDGVINEDSDEYIKSLSEYHLIDSSLTAIALLTAANIPVAIATNQSGIGRGLYSVETMNTIHDFLLAEVKKRGGQINYIAHCPHLPDDHCNCRKPKPGLLTEIASKCHFTLDQRVYFVGDSFKDIQAANNVGCTPVLVLSGKGQQTLQKHPELKNTISIHKNLLAFVTSELGIPQT